MVQRVTVRPKPKIGESLTGYLLRIANRNFVEVSNLLKSVSARHKTGASHKVDTLPERILDLELLSALVEIPIAQLHTMTFRPVFEKYLDKIDSSDDYRTAMQDSTDKVHRRFCPMCLHEEGVLKLMWQVKEIVLCDKHHVRLTSTCSVCSTEQPFLSPNIAVCRCHTCGAPLASRKASKVDDDVLIGKQLRAYADWEYLLDASQTCLVPYIKGHLKEKSLAIALLYLSQGQPQEYQTSLTKHWRQDISKGLVRMLNDENSPRWVSVEKSLQLMRGLGLQLTDIRDLHVPESFVSSLYPKKFELGVCSAPWCKYYRTNTGMKHISWKDSFHSDGQRYAFPSVCTGCYMKYGVYKGEWGNVAANIGDDIHTIRQVQELLNKGVPKREIHRKLRMHRDIIRRIAGYLAYHHLLADEVARQHTPDSVPENIVNCVKQIGHHVTDIGRAKAHALFGWKNAEFYYYMATIEAQHYMLFDEDSSVLLGTRTGRRKPLTEAQILQLERMLTELQRSETPITFQALSKELKCHRQFLHDSPYVEMIRTAKEAQKVYRIRKSRSELRTKIQEFIETKVENDEAIVAKEIYSYVGHSFNFMKKHHPWLGKWVALMAKLDQERRIGRRRENLVADVYVAVERLAADGMSVNANDIANFLGVSSKTLYFYPEVVEAMNRAKLLYNTGRVLHKNR